MQLAIYGGPDGQRVLCRNPAATKGLTSLRKLCTCQARQNEGRRSRKGGRDGASAGQRRFNASDGKSHLGSALDLGGARKFPGPPPGEGPPLRVLPIGGLGEIGMNCMLVGVHDRYILIDAGLMFPDFTDLGMQKILPDTSFLAQWRDKIEAVIVTHGHEDHIGAFPWVFPALDPSTPIWAGSFAMQLIKRRLQEYSMWDEKRFHTFEMRQRFQLGPFSCEPIRVTHSIPDCCGMILRSEAGTIVHTGDWKIDEEPIDGQLFDREFFEAMGREKVALLMSDSTNVLSQGRTTSETSVQQSIIERVLSHQGKGRIITTQFASNLHRLTSVKKAADIAGRRMCFMGMSLNTYLEASANCGRAPIDPSELVQPGDIDSIDPDKLLIVTTGSQAEPRAALNMASKDASPLLKLLPSDLVLYSAKVIPGNDTKVMQMMNRISAIGPQIAMGRHENLHTSGHAYQEELRELIRLVKPQHFLPVHGEYSFLCAHAELARETGISDTSVIRNGQMLGVTEKRNGKSVGAAQGIRIIGETPLKTFYNDGNKGTGTHDEMALGERTKLATEGLIVAAVDVERQLPNPASTSGSAADADVGSFDLGNARLHGRVRITSRALWIDQGRLLERLHKAAGIAMQRLPNDAHLVAVERIVSEALKRECRAFNRKNPEIIVIANEGDSWGAPRGEHSNGTPSDTKRGSRSRQTRKGSKDGPGPTKQVPQEVLRRRKASNPRENPASSADTEYA